MTARHRQFPVVLSALIVAAGPATGPARGDIPPIDGDPTVRFAYVIPSDRTSQPNGIAHFQESMLLVHAWYGEQMSRWGFGYKSFRYEAEADGVTPLIHLVEIPQTAEELRGDMPIHIWGNTWQALTAAGVPVNNSGEIWLVISEAHLQLGDSSIIGGACWGWGGALNGSGCPGDCNGKAMVGSDMLPFMGASVLQDNVPYDGLSIPEIGPLPLRYGVTWHTMLGSTKSSVASCNTGAIAHELGHGFGLYHDFRNDTNFRGVLMGNGLRGFRGWLFPNDFPENVTRLSYGVAMSLNAIPYFTTFTPRRGASTPDAPSGHDTYPAGPQNEPDACRSWLRLGPTGDDLPGPCCPGLKPPEKSPGGGRDGDVTWPTLTIHSYGDVDPVDGHIRIEFSASDNVGLATAVLRLKGNTVGEMPLSGTLVSEAFATPYRDGNFYNPGEVHEFKITVYDLSGNARNVTTQITPGTGFNYAPLPYVRTLPASQVRFGETLVIDAEESTDLDHDAGSLSVEWDLDGDGVFDTEPTTEKTLATSFSAPGIQRISARLTDPAGAQSVSTPIAFRVFVDDADCNGNGILDVDDIFGGAEDCNGNWVPDECEPDCNGNGVTDECDIADETSDDCDANGVPDECDVAAGFDCNENGRPDACDIADGTSEDCNGNGVPDDCDLADGTSSDDDGDGVPDECELPIRYVDVGAPTGGGGFTWQSAFNDLQDALASAAASEGYITEIWVAAGTYTPAPPAGDRNASFQLLSGVAVYGGFAGGETSVDQRDPWLNATILSGDLNGDDGPNSTNNGENSYHVVTGSDCDDTAVLDGFVITAGNANNSAYPNGWGAGMYSQNGSPTLIDCTFRDNVTNYLGGGMFNNVSSPTLIGCTFAGNRATGHGGGLHNYRSNPTLINCTFSGNWSGDYGGGIYSSRSELTLVNCNFTGNSADGGGAVHCENSSSTTIANCILWGDSASTGPEVGLTNGYDPSTVTVSYSDVQGGQAAVYVANGCILNWGAGNLDVDPLFDDADGHLGADSPCIDAADNAAIPADWLDLDHDGDPAEPIPFDFDGRLRLADLHAAPDTGNPPGNGPIVDMGVYEYQCAGDLDGDGQIALSDLAEMLGSYGMLSGATYEMGNLDGDGDVDLADLAELLGTYGVTCE